MRAIVFVILLLFAGAALAEEAPRVWSPRKPTVCDSEALSLLDAEMTKAYVEALAVSGVHLKADQRRWNGWRGKDCEAVEEPVYVDCLAAKTSGRERYLRYLVAE